jgi:hypothetical protein
VIVQTSRGLQQEVAVISHIARNLRSRKSRLTAVGPRLADHATTFLWQKLYLTSPSGGCSVGIVRLRTKGHNEEWCLLGCYAALLL